ncbi:MAG: hypothetical protein AAFY19_00625 [Pseudomonadota bacterium]
MKWNPSNDASPLSPLECVAVAARSLYSFAGIAPSWAAICTLADQGATDAQATQAAEMRRARKLVDGYERGAAGIAHKNPVSPAEGARCVNAGLAITTDGLKDKGMRRAMKQAGVSEAMAKAALTEYGTAVHRIDDGV